MTANLKTFSRRCAAGTWVCALMLAAILLNPGCASVPAQSPKATASPAKTEPAPDPAALAAKYLERFTSGSMAAKQSWDLASAAINSGDFTAALSTLEDLRAQTDLSPEQTEAIKETIAAVQNSLKKKTAP